MMPRRRKKRKPHENTTAQRGKETTSIVVVYTEQQASSAEQHVRFLQHEGLQAVTIQCNGTDTFTATDSTNWDRVDILVDRTMYDLLMIDGRLHKDVLAVFKDMDKRHKDIYLVNKFPPGVDKMDFLFCQIPNSKRYFPKQVVLCTKQAAAEDHILVLQRAGMQAVSKEVHDRGLFTTEYLSHFCRVDLLVDESMCAILMDHRRLHDDVYDAFKEMGKSGKYIYVVNRLPSENDELKHLLNQIPQNALKRFEEDESRRSSFEHTPNQGPIGMADGATETSNIAGSVTGNQNIYKVHIERVDNYQISKEHHQHLVKKIESMINVKREKDVTTESDTVNIILEFSEEFQKIIEQVVRDRLQSPEGVAKVKVRFGSIIIEMTLERGYNVTEEWIQNILTTLFNSKLASCISEGDKLRVTVQRHLYIQANEIPSLYVLHEDSRLHENCIPNTELSAQTETLKSRVRELESDLDRIREEQMTETKVLLLSKLHYSTPTDGISGYHSTDGSMASTDSHNETGRDTGTEETLPMESNRDMKLIISSTNAMLNEACRRGKMEIVKGIISAGAVDINNRSVGGLTPVIIAAWYGHKQLFHFLVEKGCDLSVMLDNGNNILHVACFGGNVDLVDFIITSNMVDKESKGMYGRTAVMKAASLGQKKVFDLLVTRDCDLSGVDDTGNTILHLACFSDNIDIVQYLITHNIADINSKGNHGRTPVMTAAERGQKKVFDLLLTRGCDLSGVDDTGNNILHLACFSDNVDIVQYLITHNIADINSKGIYGRTPVMTAAEKGQKKVFDLLMTRGSNLSGVDDTGNNILHVACFSDNVDIVRYLITHKIADVNSKGQYSRTPVMFAAERGQKKVFDLLVTRVCNLSGVDDIGYNILHLACFSDNVDIVQYLITHNIADINSKGNYGRTPVMTAAEKGQKKVFDLLMTRGCDLSGVDDDGNNILHLACFSDNVDIVQYLITHNIADVNSKGMYGRTPVMFAAEKGNKKVFDLLVTRGCDLSVVDDTGNNILHIACFSDNVNVVQYLITHNIADINSKGMYGRTPVMAAAEKGQKKVFDLLVTRDCNLSGADDNGANILHLSAAGGNVSIVEHILTDQTIDINSRDNQTMTPLQWARYFKRDKVVWLLLERGAVDVKDNDMVIGVPVSVRN